MKKRVDAFRSIGEVARLIGVAPHVLRYWETQFSQLRPMKRPDGRRYYRPEDVFLAAGLCELLREEGLTIRGAKKLLARDRGESVRARGFARLGESMGSALPDEVLPDGVDADPPDPAEEELQDMSSHAPRSRHRKRHRAGSGEALPLFPDLTPLPQDQTWLAQLVSLAALLRDAEELPLRARPAANRLGDALARLL